MFYVIFKIFVVVMCLLDCSVLIVFYCSSPRFLLQQKENKLMIAKNVFLNWLFFSESLCRNVELLINIAKPGFCFLTFHKQNYLNVTQCNVTIETEIKL